MKLKYLGRQTSNFAAGATVDVFLKGVCGATAIILKLWGGSANADPQSITPIPSWDGVVVLPAAGVYGMETMLNAAAGAMNDAETLGIPCIIAPTELAGTTAMRFIPWPIVVARFLAHATTPTNNVKIDAWAVMESDQTPGPTTLMVT